MIRVGNIKSIGDKFLYLKDHLGSTHAVINSTNTVTSAQDYDSWGYLLPDRSYNLSSMKYDYTGKERDKETTYDYFGARYYDGRIGRWGQIEPLNDEFIQYSPYSYSLNQPMRLVDQDGLGPRDGQKFMSTDKDLTNAFKREMDKGLALLSKIFSGDVIGTGEQLLYNYSHTSESFELIPNHPLVDFAGIGELRLVGQSPKIFVSLFRAVSEKEYAQIMKTGQFELAEGIISKYFAFNFESASKYAKKFALLEKEPYYIAHFKVNKKFFKSADVKISQEYMDWANAVVVHGQSSLIKTMQMSSKISITSHIKLPNF